MLLVGIGAALALAALVGIGLLGGDEEEPDPEPRPERGGRQEGKQRKRATEPARPVTLGLAIDAPVEVCLLGEGSEALIDGQVLAAGTRDEYRAKRFSLRFPAGFEPDQLKLSLDGRPRRLPRVGGPAAFRIAGPARIREAPPPGRSCP